jgi:mannose-6-phosphate isomerase-like protein (cupin superfamily)
MLYSLHSTTISKIIESSKNDLYSYRTYIGYHVIITDPRNSYWIIEDNIVACYSGNGKDLKSNTLCVEIFGYTPEDRTSTYDRLTDLPYINGCSSKQLINPVRPGDPTWQMLYMPPYTTEQQHHVHSTARVVYVHKGNGISHIGSSGKEHTIELKEGMVIILDKMIPHHFSTEESELIVLPLHVFSSTQNEYDHPMFRGTYKI